MQPETTSEAPQGELENSSQINRFKIQMQRSPLLAALVILMALQVLLTGYQIVRDTMQEQQAARQRASLSAEVAQYADTLDGLTTQLLNDYKQEVYNNPSVDSAAKQQIMGNEYNFMATMLVIRQNTRMLEVLAKMR